MEWLVLLPPLVAIILALWTRQVFLALLIGLWVGTTLLAHGNPIAGLRLLADEIVSVFADAGNTRVVLFCMLVGGLLALVQASGGVQGFVNWTQQRGWGTSRRGAELMAWLLGIVIFVESSISPLIVGAVSRPFFDRLRIPREKLAFYCDTTSAPVCMSIPLNGWGAYVLGLLMAQGLTAGAVPLLVHALAFNLYSLLAIFFALLLALTGWAFGPMKQAEERANKTGALLRPGATPLISEELDMLQPLPNTPHHPLDLVIPIFSMVIMIFLGLYITGEGDIMEGSGSTAVLWAVSTGILVAMLQYQIPRPLRGGKPVIPLTRSIDLVLKGCSGLVPVTVLIVLAFALGQVSRELEMGPYLVGIIQGNLPPPVLPALVFLVACFVSFTLGSSWTTFAILIPVALPLASGLNLPPALMLGALLSGGVFGDHASPLSDTSIISSMAAACDHVDHIQTQLPYSLLLAGISMVLYLVAGWLL